MPAVARRTAIVVAAPRRSKSSNSKLEKLTKHYESARRHLREMSDETEQTVITVAVPAALGLLKAKGTELPTFGGFNPLLVWGAGLAIAGPKLIGGRWGKRIGAGGVGMLAAAAHTSGATGTFRVSGDEIGYDEIGADDDDD